MEELNEYIINGEVAKENLLHTDQKKYRLFVTDNGKIYKKRYRKKKGWSGYIRLKTFNNNGYLQVMVDGHCCYVGRLVAETWLELPKDYGWCRYDAHHRNQIRNDNRAENLYWVKKRFHRTLHSVKQIKRLGMKNKILKDQDLIDVLGEDFEKILADIQKNNHNNHEYEAVFYASNDKPVEIKLEETYLYVRYMGYTYEIAI